MIVYWTLVKLHSKRYHLIILCLPLNAIPMATKKRIWWRFTITNHSKLIANHDIGYENKTVAHYRYHNTLYRPLW